MLCTFTRIFNSERIMMILIQIAVLFLFLEAGEALTAILHLPVPGSIIGMVLLAFSLKFKLLKLEWVADAADFLCANLGFFFIPAGVGVMQCFGLIEAEWWPITAATVLSTVLIIFTTGWAHKLTRNYFHRLHK